jgi:DNA-binding NtrC family response regulator
MARILIVEDDENIRGYLLISLDSSGHLAKSTATLAQAREELEFENYDVVVVDARLPDGKGIDLAAEANARGKRAIIISGDSHSIKQMKESGIAYLQKPFELPALLSAIETGRISGSYGPR